MAQRHGVIKTPIIPSIDTDEAPWRKRANKKPPKLKP
jgi:hypothetical protein